MKNSKYNIFFPNEDKIVGYNSISDNFIILEPILHDLFDASVKENMVCELKNVHVDLHDILVQKGFLIDNSINELELIKKISHETDFNDAYYQLVINPTMNCNFKCWYCYETHIKDSKMTNETLIKITKFVDNILEGKKGVLKDFSLQWFGGEPLLYFNKTILPLLENIYPKMLANDVNFSSGFTTNGLLIDQKLLDDCKKYGVNHFQITLDGHRERHNKVRFVSKTKGSYDEIVKNIKLCLSNKFIVTARINISEETIDDLLKIIDDFKYIPFEDKKYLIFSFHEVWQEEKNLTADISEIVEEFRKHNLTSNYKGESSASIKSSCYADRLNHATINYNGNVFKCTARDFDINSREGELEDSGTITWNEKFQKRIYDTRFKNKPCLECKILPICNGGCSQSRLENEGVDYCVHNFDENSKLSVVKEKFYSRIARSAPSNHYNITINSLLEINFKNFKKHEPLVFQETLSSFFEKEINSNNLIHLGKVNNLYIEMLKGLRKNQLETYTEVQQEITQIVGGLTLNETEKKVNSLLALPIIAYYYFKKGDYQESLNYTHASILNDDFFLDQHPFLYGHKIQQLHNIIRTHFRKGNILEACELCNQVMGHLISGKNMEYHVGYWNKFEYLKEDDGITGMIYQIFSETTKTITDIANSTSRENELFTLAFGNINVSASQSENLKLITLFMDIKFNLTNNFSSKFNKEKVDQWVNISLDSQWAIFTISMYYNLFSSIGINSFKENKDEFKRIYFS